MIVQLRNAAMKRVQKACTIHRMMPVGLTLQRGAETGAAQQRCLALSSMRYLPTHNVVSNLRNEAEEGHLCEDTKYQSHCELL